jgi:tetratricopeptide (TPR) repeat protein
MPVLQVNSIQLDAGRRRVEVVWRQEGLAPQAAASTFTYEVDKQDAEKIRWYLEDYLEFPADPAPVLAADAETRLTELGTGLFRQVFTGLDAAGIWAQAQAHLSRVRVEVDIDPADAPGLPWELLRTPGTGTALALGAGEFVRTHRQAAGQVRLPQPAGDQLRVLLVICRPSRGDDVPFRSVASRLVRGGAGEMAGLHLDVLRPATYARLAEVLHQAADAGRPYHVVHFDGHGTYLDLADHEEDQTSEEGQATAGGGSGIGGSGIGLSPLRYGLSAVGPVRPGQHGYLIFEDPDSPANQQFADGPTLGGLLTATSVPVLVLNACRSAYTEAPSRPAGPDARPEDAGPGPAAEAAEGSTGPADDVHARIRAYGSLAAEVADTGVPGVVAMRYNVYVVTAAQYMADLYAHLLSGKTLGQAATQARRALADNPDRQISAAPVALQDWAVPLIYEAAPLTLLQPEQRQAPLINLTPADGAAASAGADQDVPRPPDAGFFGRDETLLAVDRAFDTNQVVLLHAYAGAGKTSTAAEFARWYRSTGGLDHPQLGTGPVLWSTFEHYLPLDRLLDAVGDTFAPALEANDIHWQAITDSAQRRNLVLQLLAQVPVLWVWDNTEPVTGFPPGTQSAWTHDEQDQVAAFLRDLAQQTKCKVLVTSRRDERAWLGELPARVQLPPMPMRESLQLARALAARHGHHDPGTDWRPLLRYAAGNPLAITVLVGQALRDNLTTTADLEAFVAQLRAGEQDLEPGEDATLGRTRSLAASLSYGFAHAFTEPERAQLAVLHLFRDTVDADALRGMGDPNIAGHDAIPQLAGLTRDTTIALLGRAADIGLLSALGGGFYQIHPALPWYFTTLYATTCGAPNSLTAQRAAHAYSHTVAQLGIYYHGKFNQGQGDPVLELRAEEANLHHALTLARHTQDWDDVVGCLQGLETLYQRTGRDREWARLFHDITPDFIDPTTDGPLPGREGHWSVVTGHRVRLAMKARDWPSATRLQHAAVTRDRDQAAAALATPDDQLTPDQRNQIRNLDVSLEYLGHILRWQDDPGCLPYYEEALSLAQRIGDRPGEAMLATSLGNAYKDVPSLRNLAEAERWYRRSLSLKPEHNTVGRAKSLGSLAGIAYQRFLDARKAREPEPVLLEHLNAALAGQRQALDMTHPDDHESLAIRHNELGIIYRHAGHTQQALHHYQRSIAHSEARDNAYQAGLTRLNIAIVLQDEDRPGDALHYARAALDDLRRVGPGAAQKIADTQTLITYLEQATG